MKETSLMQRLSADYGTKKNPLEDFTVEASHRVKM